ncbi:L,D-transpeptidase family protein [Streptomyces albipurpureus]|uniref:Ig-like domain-containing protein n=1 Tax=Streptomyces albipurpureus TaxID=2897419 RepID=A0ABT0UH99_9ACTN|nr:Ig-like domain-containing protein [Streptomyces sp. CWNU-1]MCM2387810.1 Ig-like domain-containing protein [Streptomyces sp. CWNU-1]
MVAAVLAPLALTGCTSDPASAKTDDKAGGAKGGGSPATVTVTPSGKAVKPGEPVRVTAQGGSLTSVTVTDGKGGRLTGRISERNTVWTSHRRAVPDATYAVTAVTKTAGGTTGTRQASFSTAAAGKVNKVDWRPGENTTIGIAHPISLVFDNPVKNRAEVEKQLRVTTSNNTEGSWGWMRDWSGKDRVDWRPREYWRPGTKVSLKAELNGTDSGAAGGWFVRDYSTAFTIGARQIVQVDLDNFKLTLNRDGKQIRGIPISGGTPGGDKRSWRGTTVLMSKEGTINMNSETVGLGDAYNKMVDYSMRLTWSGMYAHAAPWNSAHLGRANKSSGCVGMSTADAASFYRDVRVGDPFEITGEDTKGTPGQGNGFSNWNLSWEQWRKLSALR